MARLVMIPTLHPHTAEYCYTMNLTCVFLSLTTGQLSRCGKSGVAEQGTHTHTHTHSFALSPLAHWFALHQMPLARFLPEALGYINSIWIWSSRPSAAPHTSSPERPMERKEVWRSITHAQAVFQEALNGYRWTEKGYPNTNQGVYLLSLWSTHC